MKKLFSIAAIVAAMSLTACSGNKANTAEEDALTPEEVTALNETLESVQEEVQAIITSGDLNDWMLKDMDAKVDELINAVKAKCLEEEAACTAEEQAAAFNALVEEIKSKGIDGVNEVIESIKADLQSINETGDLNVTMLQGVKTKISALNNFLSTTAVDAEAAKDEAVEAAKAQADAAVEAGKAKVNEAVEAGKAQVNEAVEAGKAKANEAVQDAADKANKAASDAINGAAGKLKL